MNDSPTPITVYRSPNPRPFQALWVGIAILALLPGVALAGLRLISPGDDSGALMASFVPYGIVFDLIAVIFSTIALIRARNRRVLAVLTGFCALLLIVQLIWIGPQFVPDDRPATTDTITLLSLNLKNGQADLDQLQREAMGADVVNLVEVTPRADRSIRDLMADDLPYIASSVGKGANASMVLSRFPITEVQRLDSALPQLSLAVRLPEIGPTNLISAHPCNPYCDEGLWLTEHQELLQRARELPDRPTIIAGDFNAILDHRPMRKLEAAGFTSATDIVGAGWQPTYPANRTLPPMLQIDHIMLNDQLTATMIETVSIRNTDHLGLRADIAGTR